MMTTRRKLHGRDIRFTFDELSDDVLLDDGQLALLASVAPSTWKRWRREKRLPPPVRLSGRPRYRVGDVRELLKGKYPPV
jgi:hypothetical protein